jgi:CBS domain-containing protein
MLRLRDIMATDVVAISSKATVRDAMELLSRHHVSGAPVVNGLTLVGVVSATDLMEFTAALPGVPTELDTREEWSESIEPSPDDQIDEENDPGCAFYADMWEDAGADVTQRLATPSTPEWNALEEHTVDEVMTGMPLITLGPDASAETAADLMRTKGIHRILVTEDDKLVGIVSALDIVKAAADHRFTVRQFVFNRDDGIIF